MNRWLISVIAVLLATIAGSNAAMAQTDITVRRFAFDSGLVVVLARVPSPPGQDTRAFVGAYSAFGENMEPEVGLAHFVEHVAANSYPTSPAPEAPASTRWINGNAMTKANHLVYLTVVSPEGLETAVHGRLAPLGAIRIGRQVVEHERERVLNELNQQWPAWSAYKAADALASGLDPDPEVERTNVRNITPEALAGLVRRTHVPGRGVLVVAGDIDLDVAEAAVRRAAAALDLVSARPAVDAPAARAMPEQGGEVTLPIDPAGGFTAAVAFNQPAHAGADFPAFMVLDQLLLGGRTDAAHPERSDSSPLGRRLVDRIGASKLWDGKVDGGGVPMAAEGDPSRFVIVFSLSSATTPARVAEAVTAALRDVRHENVEDFDVRAAQTALAGYYRDAFTAPSLQFLADHLAAFALADRDPAEVLELPSRIEALTGDQVRDMFDRTLLAQRPAVAIIAPASQDAVPPAN